MPPGWDHVYLYGPARSLGWMRVLAVSTRISLRLWDEDFFCEAVPWSSTKQPDLLIRLNKWPVFTLSVDGNKKAPTKEINHSVCVCEMNVLSALLCGRWRRW